MATRTLKVYINDQFYKEITVETTEGMLYDPTPVLQQLTEEREAGMMDQYNIPPGTFPIRIEYSPFK